jgi:hypothetical protein
MQHFGPPVPTPTRKVVSAWQGYNRRRWEFERDVLPVDERAPFVCECTSDACLDSLDLTMYEFEAAHMCPAWCAVRPGHMLEDDGGRIVIQEPHFWVVELLPLPSAPASSARDNRQIRADHASRAANPQNARRSFELDRS